MAWSPKYIDRPLRFIYDPEVWGVCCIAFGILMLAGINQTLALGLGAVLGMPMQKFVDHHKRGYIIHLLHAAGVKGLLTNFPKYGKYRF